MRDDDLLIPSTVRNLCREGSRVRSLVALDACDGDGHEIPAGSLGTVLLTALNGDALVAFVDPVSEDVRWRWCDAADVALDLSDATSRYHALLYLARHFGLVGIEHGVAWKYRCMWVLETPAMRINFAHSGRGGRRWMPVPGLSDLDLASDKRLPDGSLFVAALALARVVAHVAGVQHG